MYWCIYACKYNLITGLVLKIIIKYVDTSLLRLRIIIGY